MPAVLGLGLLLIFVLAGLLGVGSMVLWVWMLVDCATNEPDTGNTKIVWILIIVFAHWIGALIYLIVRRPRRIEEMGR